jgi:NTP pyrophosphatase (non-canonical NTP hydrolase)
LSEIFQWKGDLEDYLATKHDPPLPFSVNEIVHIGEEIADVFIYTTRLADVCCIDLSNAVKMLLEECDRFVARRTQRNEPWTSFNFNTTVCEIKGYRSHRHVALEIQAQVGMVTGLFAKYSESNAADGLPYWTDEDVDCLAHALASICSFLIVMAKLTNLSIGHVVADKFSKNATKYPVALSKNSSAKYTKYLKSGSIQDKQFLLILVSTLSVTMVAFYVGRHWK